MVLLVLKDTPRFPPPQQLASYIDIHMWQSVHWARTYKKYTSLATLHTPSFPSPFNW